MTIEYQQLNSQFVGRRVSVRMADGNHRNGEVLAINERGVVGSRGEPFNMRPIYGETAEIRFDQPYGGWGEVSTQNITFI
jgi:hypothetical protein